MLNKFSNKGFFFLLFLTIFILISFFYRHLFESPFFIHWDDAKNIVDNNAIKEISTNSIRTIFSSLYVGMYVPITQLSYLIDYSLFGLSSFGFHISSLIYHFITTIVLFIFLSKFFDNKTSFILSLVFLIHPVNIEPVGWLSARSTIIFTLFYLLSLIQYVNYLQKEKKLYYLFAFCFFILSALAKSTAITLPIVLIGLDCYFKKTYKIVFLKNKIPFLLVSLIVGYITTLTKVQAPLEYGYFENLLLVFYRIFFYLDKFIFPFHYSAFYSINSQFLNSILILSLFLLLIIIGIGYYLVRKKIFVKNPDIILGLFLFLTTISINLNVVPFSSQIISDRYLYLPMIGLLIVLGFYIQKFLFQKIQLIFKSIIIFFVIYLFFTSLKFINYWKNEETYFQESLKVNSDAMPVENVLAVIYKNKKEYQKALNLFNDIIAKYPNYVEALNNRGNLLLKFQKYEKASCDFNKIISLGKATVSTYINIGNLRFSLEQYSLSIESYKKAIYLDPHSYLAYDHLGRLYAYINHPEEAKYYLSKAIKLNISYGKSYQTRGMVYILFDKDTLKGCRDLSTAEKYGINVKKLKEKFCK